MRSFWMRNIMMTSTPAMPASSDVERSQPANSVASGMSARGATMRISRDAERGEHVPGRARDARVPDVADDGDLEAVEALLRLEDRQRIEQALGRMRDVRFAGRQHARVRLHVRRRRARARRTPHRESRTRRRGRPRACRSCRACSRPSRARTAALRDSPHPRRAAWPRVRRTRACVSKVR